MNTQRGFTLLEIMLVIVIIASCATLVLMTPNQRLGRSALAEQALQQLTGAVEYAADRATLQGGPLGLQLTASGWQLWQPVLSQPEKWRWEPLRNNNNQPYKGEWPVSWTAGGESLNQASQKTPQILIQPDGEITPFSLTLTSSETQKKLRLECPGALPPIITSDLEAR